MNIIKVEENCLVNGKGLRLAVFVAGCPHQCKGCFSQYSWSKDHGEKMDELMVNNILRSLSNHDGLSILGGEPLAPYNWDFTELLLKHAKDLYPSKDTWLWTGYGFGYINAVAKEDKKSNILEYIDYIIDGKFEEGNPTNKPWRGSNNQNLIHLVNGRIQSVT